MDPQACNCARRLPLPFSAKNPVQFSLCTVCWLDREYVAVEVRPCRCYVLAKLACVQSEAGKNAYSPPLLDTVVKLDNLLYVLLYSVAVMSENVAALALRLSSSCVSALPLVLPLISMLQRLQTDATPTLAVSTTATSILARSASNSFLWGCTWVAIQVVQLANCLPLSPCTTDTPSDTPFSDCRVEFWFWLHERQHVDQDCSAAAVAGKRCACGRHSHSARCAPHCNMHYAVVLNDGEFLNVMLCVYICLE